MKHPKPRRLKGGRTGNFLRYVNVRRVLTDFEAATKSICIRYTKFISSGRKLRELGSLRPLPHGSFRLTGHCESHIVVAALGTKTLMFYDRHCEFLRDVDCTGPPFKRDDNRRVMAN